MARRTILRRSAEDIARRRQYVRRFHLLGYTPKAIQHALEAQAPDALAGQADPYETILDDISAITQQEVTDLQHLIGLPALAAYVAAEREILKAAMASHENEKMTAQARIRALNVANDCVRNIARAAGLPVDAPAFSLNLNQLIAQVVQNADGTPALFLPEGTAAPRLSGGPIVDPLTFAISPDFCGLSLDNYPMQELVLREFMAPTGRKRVLILVCGMRSGKGVVGSIVAWYAAYQLLSLADPQRYYGLTPNQEIQIITMATSRDQAHRNVFKHITDRLETGGTWFQALREQAEVVALEVRLPRNIIIRCGHSKASTQVGGTSYAVILDELARMKDTEGRDNATEVYDKMSATTATFGEHGRVVVLTSPEWEGDKSMQLLEQALEINTEGRQVRPQMMGLQLPTWEANRTLAEEMLWETQDGEANPAAFWRDFGARPPLTQEGYYPDPGRWDRQADPALRHPYDDEGRLAEWFQPCCDGRRFVHVDLGLKRDACGMAMAHKPVPGCPWFQARDGEPNPRAKAVVLEAVHRLVPGRQRETKGEISFERVRQFIRDWSDRGFNVKGGLVSYDGWQSLDSQQTLKREGYRVREFSLDKNTEGHDTLQELLNTDRLAYYAHPVLVAEGKRLMLVRGRKVDHPPKGSKDTVDAVAGAVYHALKRGGRMTFVG
ncbi:MAG: hypothetical protein A2V88_08695 [Elusimicrobia bacterium RBG_16_66_12]|nr:MAG: hypothetical protein A2V88_08695 [Elusimicrobia bacterium RBG_16_66_12]